MEENEKLNVLEKYIDMLKKNYLIKRTDNFPNKNDLKKNKEMQISIIVEQGMKLLDLQSDNCFFGLNIHHKDRHFLIEKFISDLEQYATINNIYISDNQPLLFAQSRIPEHAFFHLASSAILPSTYKTIAQHSGDVFDIYSIPFKIRAALENKLKSMIGFKKITFNVKSENINSIEFPFSYMINILSKLNCMNLPCSLSNIKNIYQWSCNFCHTGEKEPIWLSMKALDIISVLFLYEFQVKYRIEISELWHRYVLSTDYIVEKLFRYKGFVKPVYYFKKNWSVSKLENYLNNIERKKYKIRGGDVEFSLSEMELSEVSYYWCGRMERYY
ncbi:hypothetical protein RGO69_000443 [Morganella morganii]|nr:hypothetical protein [Morganella morganii]